MPRENFELNPVTVGTEVVLEQGSDRVNGCFVKINQRVAGSTVVGQMVGQHELMWLWPDVK